MSQVYEYLNPSEVGEGNQKMLVRRVSDGRVAICRPSWFIVHGDKLYPKNAYNSLRLSVLFMF